MKGYLKNLAWVVIFFAVFFIGCEAQRSAEVVQPIAPAEPEPEVAEPQLAVEAEPETVAC